MSNAVSTTVEPQQLSLAIRLSDQATFANFCCAAGSFHQQVVDVLENTAHRSEPFVYLWGSAGSGVSHLLQAACHDARQQGQQVQYLPLLDLMDFPPQQLFESLEQLDLICLDNLPCIAEEPQWQQAVFDLYNRVRDAGGRLLIGADCAPRELPLSLADLQSRLTWGPVFQLPVLDDEQKAEVIQFRAARRGMEFADESVQFFIRRSERDMSKLISKLDQLEQLAVSQKRKLTIPFLKQTFGW